MWNVPQHITSGIALIAFLGLLILTGYSATLKHRHKIINRVPRQQRSKVITKELNAFGIDATKLTREQQFSLATKELDLRARRYLIAAIVPLVALIIFEGMTVVAIVNPTRPETGDSESIVHRLDYIQQLIENKDARSQELTEFINQRGLDQKYPLGFALFYSDGRKLLYYGHPSSNGISFDPSDLRVTRVDDYSWKLNVVPMRSNQKALEIALENISDITISNNRPTLLVRASGVSLYTEPLASSGEAAAWVIGMKPTT